MSPARHHHALPEGYQLHWYQIDSILGQGGFGITYLARDSNLDQLVAIKEFLPSDLAVRTRDSTVQPLSGGHSDTYGWGLNRFLTEARTLAKFRHPNIVRVMSVFEANNTAYMVMEYERGESFENLLKFKQVSGEATLRKILLALLDGLQLVHDAGFIHRDIKPSNVYLREDGVPVLLDFGSARLALGVETRTLTSLVSPGYAPFEQYNATRESDKQGPWTDIYALGATMYRAVSGRGPVDAAARANSLLEEQRDPFEPCAQMALQPYSEGFLQAIDRALAFSPADRPQSVTAWRQLLRAAAVDNEAETVAADGPRPPGGSVDFLLDGEAGSAAPSPDATRTVPMAELEKTAPPAPPATASARRWFAATSVVVIAGVAVAAWLSLHPRARDTGAPRLAAPAPALPAPASAPGIAAVQEPTAPSPTAPSPTAPSPTAPSAAAPEPPSPPAPPPAAAPAGTAAAATAVTAKIPDESAAPAPPPEKKPAEKIVKAAPPPPPAPAGKSTASAAAPKSKPSATPARPTTRAEKVAARLAMAAENVRANRLTKPRRRNALADYMTVLAMDKDNVEAHQGVEAIVQEYVARSRAAMTAGRLDEAGDNLHQARFVLDAMKFRDWPRATYDALFTEYREVDRRLAASR